MSARETVTTPRSGTRVVPSGMDILGLFDRLSGTKVRGIEAASEDLDLGEDSLRRMTEDGTLNLGLFDRDGMQRVGEALFRTGVRVPAVLNADQVERFAKGFRIIYREKMSRRERLMGAFGRIFGRTPDTSATATQDIYIPLEVSEAYGDFEVPGPIVEPGLDTSGRSHSGEAADFDWDGWQGRTLQELMAGAPAHPRESPTA